MFLISNSQGAHRVVSTFVTDQDDGGEALHQPTGITEYRANAAISVGQVVSFVAGTATVPLSVKPMATGDSVLIFAGIAQNSAIAGETVQVAQVGHALLAIGAGTPAFGEYLTKPAVTAGLGVNTATAIDATTVAGTVLGVFVGTKAASNLAPVFLTRF